MADTTQTLREPSLRRSTREPDTDHEEYSAEIARSRALADRYRVEFVDMDEFRIDRSCSGRFPRI